MKSLSAFAAVLLAAAGLSAQEAAVEPARRLPPLTVTADTPAPAVLAPVAESLARMPGLLVNPQGVPAGQADLSIRGSSFSGAGLSLSGLSLRHPQTEHFHAELPFPPALFAPPRVLSGFRQAEAGGGFLAGSVALDFAPVSDRQMLSSGAGERSRNWQELLVGHAREPDTTRGTRLGVNAFAGRERADSVDYGDNDLERWHTGLHVQWAAEQASADVAVGHRDKQFGARGYYGVDPDWRADEATEDTLGMAAARWSDGPHALRFATAWRRFRDHYRLFPEESDRFENRHESDVAAIFVGGTHARGSRAGLRWRVDAEHERIDSSGLGDHSRSRGAALLMPWVGHEGLALSAGLQGETFTDESAAVLPRAELAVQLRPGRRAAVAYVETVRRPSYTELNYESPASLGSQGLDRQAAQTVEAVYRDTSSGRCAWSAAVFARRSRDTVDWIRDSPEATRWVATDIGTVDTVGLELEARVRAGDKLLLEAAYAWLEKDFEDAFYAGRYVLDYPEHLLQVSAVLRAGREWELRASQALRRQTSHPLRTSDRTGAPGALSLQWRPAAAPRLAAAAGVDNAWDDGFEPLAGQKPAGRRVWGALSMRW